MKKSISIFAAFAAILLAFSCKKDDFKQVESGLFTKFTVEITTPAPTDIANTKATDLQETVVDNLALLFYKDAESTPIVVRVSEMGTPAGSGTNYIYTVNIDSSDADSDGEPLLSGNYYLYAVANYNRIGFGGVSLSELKSTALKDLHSILVRRSQVGKNDLDMNEGALLMSGFYGSNGQVTILGGDATNLTDRIHLRRISSKVKFQFQSGSGVNFEPQSYSIYNYPVKSTLFERQGWQTKNGAAAPANGTYPGSIPAIVTSDDDVTSIENIEFTDGTFTFYTYENAQVAKTGFTGGYAGREKRNADYDTFTYAPDYGTYVVVKGRYAGPISSDNSTAVTGDVTYTIHLGDFSASTGDDSNFTVRRNSKQNFSVTVNGVNNIYVEATTNVEGQPGAEGNLVSAPTDAEMVFDAHYCCRIASIPATTTFPNYQVISKTPFDDNVTWASGTDRSVLTDISWVKFVKPTSDGKIPNYPGTQNTSMYTDIIGLVEDIKAGSETYYTLSDGSYKTAIFIDEFYYNSTPLTKYVNVDDRELILVGNANAHVSADAHSSYFSDAFFNVKQHSIKTMYRLDKEESYYPFGIESIEETRYNTWKNRTNSKNLGNCGTSEDNGQYNCLNNLLTLTNNRQWATYINNGELVSAARSSQFVFLTRNRDEDGDGYIDANEIKWYIPAAEQAYGIILGQHALGSAYPVTPNDDLAHDQLHNNRWYWTSSPDHKHFNTMELNVFTLYGGWSSQPCLGSVVCCRTLKSYNSRPSNLLDYDGSNNTITATNLNPSCVRGPMSGEYLNHFQLDARNILPESFQLAQKNLEVPSNVEGAEPDSVFTVIRIRTDNLCQDYYYQNPDKSDLGQWRIPNERELLAVALLVPKDSLIAPGRSGSVVYELAARTSMNVIINSSHTSDRHYFTPVYHLFQDTADGYAVSQVNQTFVNYVDGERKTTTILNDTTPAFFIRCVRDVATAAMTGVDSQSGPGDFQDGGAGI